MKRRLYDFAAMQQHPDARLMLPNVPIHMCTIDDSFARFIRLSVDYLFLNRRLREQQLYFLYFRLR